ncbi:MULTISPECIES: ThiF family adenylyltransferase [unclassified Pseudomonas]|uniref:ThiF family adenylyltransferase n=1 Tax=unclassified Pseudomonas TaxID=196821 RepID=UPI000A20099C|nr:MULTISPECIES: ThiF family adenylyltransferase [unclassified Pseudomonas]
MPTMRNVILDDLTSDECILEVIPSWTVENADQHLWLHSEKGDSIVFSNTQDEYHILADASSDGLIGRRVSASTGKRYRTSALANLWELGLIRVHDGSPREAADTETRFVWQDEYFKAFASSTNSVQRMNTRLQNSTVCIVGAGAAGSLAALMLAAAGVGGIRLVDGDRVARSNLPRQFLYPESSIGQHKAEVLRDILLAQHSPVRVEALTSYVDSQEQALSAASGTEFILLTADQPRLKIREWIGKASLALRTPYLAMASNWIGPISVPFQSPCYLCQARTYRSRYADPASFLQKLTAHPLPARAAFGPRPALVASFMTSTILHFLTGNSSQEALFESFKVSLDGYTERQAYIRYRNCPACSESTTV